MAKPKSKDELLHQSQVNFQKLVGLIDALPAAEQVADFPPGTMNRNIRDVLGHLYHWHLMFLDWYHVGMTGQKPDMPAKGHTWKTTQALNREIWEACQEHPLADMRGFFEASHRDVHTLIERHSDEELFEKKRYHWTGSTSLGAYLISATSSHYDWGIKLIRKMKK